MAVPFLTTLGLGLRKVGQVLTGAAARTAASTVHAAKRALSGIRGGVARGVAPKVIEKTLQKAGIPVPQPTLTKVITTERKRRAQSQALKFLGRTRRPNPTRLPLSLTPIGRAFSFLVELKGIDERTGEAVQKWITIATDELLTRQEIEDRAASMFEADPEKYQIKSPSFALVEGMRAPGTEV